MKKKEYKKPEMQVYDIKRTCSIAGPSSVLFLRY